MESQSSPKYIYLKQDHRNLISSKLMSLKVVLNRQDCQKVRRRRYLFDSKIPVILHNLKLRPGVLPFHFLC